MTEAVEEAIVRAKTIYQRVTGRTAPDAPAETPYARIPPEVDREDHVLRQAAVLLERVQAASLQHSVARPAAAAGWAPPLWVVPPAPWTAGRPGAAPALAIPVSSTRTREELRFSFEVPGVPRNRVEVELRGVQLRVLASRPALAVAAESDAAPAGAAAITAEQLVQLPFPVQPSAVDAVLADGLLTVRVRIPAADDEAHKIEVR